MSSRYDLFDQKWCVIHSCPAAADKHSCFWDLWAGHRPGRAVRNAGSFGPTSRCPKEIANEDSSGDERRASPVSRDPAR